MRVVHVINAVRLELGGVVRAVLDIAQQLAARGHDVTLITWDAKDVPGPWRAGGPGLPSVAEVPRPAGPLGRLTGPQLADVWARCRGADVLHLHTPWELANLQLASAARRAGVGYVLSVHGMLDDWSMAQKGLKKKLFLALGARAMLERAAAVHCTARAELDQARRWFPRGRGEVIPLVFDLAPFRVLPGPERARAKYLTPGGPARGPLVLFLSRIHEKKGLDVLVDASAELGRRGTPVTLLVAGTGDAGYERACRDRAASGGVDARFLGLVTGEDKVSLYELADVFALPTSQENFGFVFPEALACGTPVVTTRGVDIWPELESSGGAVIAPQTPGGFADALAPLLKDPARRADMGRRGRAWVLEALDPGRVVRGYEALYERARAPRGGSQAA